MPNLRRTILVGIDGASYTLLKELSGKGVVPNFSKLCSDGVFTQMRASLPDNSAVSWSSIMTGKNPGEHGIFGFTDLIPHTYTMSFPNFLNMKSKPFWSQNIEKRYVIINLPFTYPVHEINGCIVSGFLSPDINKSTYPDNFLHYLKSINYKIDADTRKIYQSKGLFLDDLFLVHEKRRQVYREIWERGDWDTFMVVFTGTDRIGHYMLDAYINEDAPCYSKFLEYYTLIDAEIGWIAERLDSKDNMIMVSDHGMELIDIEVYLNTYLEEKNFLILNNKEQGRYNRITNKTKAFALEPSRIYLNYKDRYPNGIIEEEDRESVILDLITIFNALEYKGRKVISTTYRKEDIYHGNCFDYAPDLILEPNEGFSLRGAVGNKEIFNKDDILVGMHKGNDAFLYVKGNNARDIIPEHVCVEDILPIMRALEDEK